MPPKCSAPSGEAAQLQPPPTPPSLPPEGNGADMVTAAAGMAAVSSGMDVASTFAAAVGESVLGGHGCCGVSLPLRERPPPQPLLTWQLPLSTFTVALLA